MKQVRDLNLHGSGLDMTAPTGSWPACLSIHLTDTLEALALQDLPEVGW